MPTIRPATDSDKLAVAHLLSASDADAGAASNPLDAADQVIIAEDDLKNTIGLVSLRVDSSPSGDPSTGEVTALYVVPTHRRQKIAMLLLAEAERTSRDQGIAELNARVDGHNATTAAFLRAMGYTPTETGFKKQLPPKRSAKSRRAEG